MFITNTEEIAGKKISVCHGVVSGSTVRAKHAGRDIMAGLKNIMGGELTAYTELLTESRDQAIQRMEDQAQQMGANAIVNVRFSTSSVTAGASEIYVYGTAVTVE
ncbi:MAG: YbjQ family protein [Immundisolibacteraceae bacterium]|nr:YbjQ family protein [Immundisolibacteraceae bacterium]